MYLAAMQKTSYRIIARFQTRFFDEFVPLSKGYILIWFNLIRF